jgi:zinc/manganese transport system substrate-binding protein
MRRLPLCSPAAARIGAAALALAGCAAAHAAIAIVAAESVYGDVARAVGGVDVAVTSVLASPDQDPHAFEPGVSVAVRIAEARIVIHNGAGYDPWIERLLAGTATSDRVTLDVARLAGRKPGDNPHLWYDVGAIDALVRALRDELSRVDVAHRADYTARAERFAASLRPLRERMASLRSRYAGTPVTATEPVFGYMSDALGLAMRNARFQLAVMNGTEPGAGDIAALERDLRTRVVKVLISNRQTRNALTARMRAIAARSGVPVVDVTETQPPRVEYAQWMLSQLDELARALATAR